MVSKDPFEVSSQNPIPSESEIGGEQQISRRHLLALMGAGGTAAAISAVLAGCSLGGSDTSTTGSSTTSQGSQSTSQAPVATQPPAATQAPAPTQPPAQTGGNVIAHAASVPVNSAHTFPITGQSNPGVLVHLSDGKFVAFDSTCTHQQCAVSYQPSEKLLVCPCHGAMFDPAKDAAVVQGPAQTPLKSIKIMVNANGTITTA